MRRLPVVSAVSALAAILLAIPAGARAAGQAPAGPAQEPVAVGSGGAVASMDVGASQAGIDVLKHGGNAVDAAVATASALGVTVPFVAGPGGGGFMVIYLAKTHQVVTIDGRENCPAACTTTMFLDPKTGQPLDYDYASDQPLATGVPSMVAAWAKAVSLYGRKSLGADLQPAIGVAERGFRVNQDFVQLTQSGLPELQAYPASRALLLTKDGNPLPVGYPAAQSRPGQDLPAAGQIRPVLPVRRAPRPGHRPGRRPPGADSRADRGPAPRHPDHERPARLSGTGAGADPGALPRPGHLQHGAAVEQRFHRRRDAEHPERVQPVRRARVTALFHYLEASRLAYADRNAYVGDPRYVSVPLSGLLDPAFAATRRCLIHTRRWSRRWPRAIRTRPTDCPAQTRSSLRLKAATPTTSSPPTSGATSSPSPTRSTSSAAAARPCPATDSCSTTR